MSGRGIPRTALATLYDLHQAEPDVLPVAVAPTGFSPLDEVLNGGVRRGDLLLVGGKPGSGKTVAALQWSRHMVRNGWKVVYACYEHDHITLLARLLGCELAETAIAQGVHDDLLLEELHERLRDAALGSLALRDVLASHPLLDLTSRRVADYAENLVLVQASGVDTDVGMLARAVDDLDVRKCVLVVDYLQKVPVIPEPDSEAERVRRTVEALKEYALDRSIGVVAIAAADQAGLSSRRLHLRHFRGSTALSYEADAVVVLNEKMSVVATAHRAFAGVRAEEFRRTVVFSVEKNRNGAAGIDLEFTKDFAHYRFDPNGTWAVDQLVSEDEGVE
jgi:replicative DNA helicase